MPPQHLLLALLSIRHVMSTATCYDMNGNVLDSNALTACNPSATGKDDSHSACCNTLNRDACLSTGLCLAAWSSGSDSMFWVGGCTDSTWQDPSCARYCVNNVGDQSYSAYSLLACTNSTWCCGGDWNDAVWYGDKEECCKNSFTLPASGIGTVIRQLGPAATASGTETVSSSGASETASQESVCAVSSQQSNGSSDTKSSGSSSTALAVVGGVLGAALAASLVLLVVLALSNRKLRRRVQTPQDPVAPPAQEPVKEDIFHPPPPPVPAPAPAPAPAPFVHEVPLNQPQPFQQPPPQQLELSASPSVRPAELGENNIWTQRHE